MEALKKKGIYLDFAYIDQLYICRLLLDGNLQLAGSRIEEMDDGREPHDAVTLQQLTEATTFTSPNGTEWKLSVADDGTITSIAQ